MPTLGVIITFFPIKTPTLPPEIEQFCAIELSFSISKFPRILTMGDIDTFLCIIHPLRLAPKGNFHNSFQTDAAVTLVDTRTILQRAHPLIPCRWPVLELTCYL